MLGGIKFNQETDDFLFMMIWSASRGTCPVQFRPGAHFEWSSCSRRNYKKVKCRISQSCFIRYCYFPACFSSLMTSMIIFVSISVAQGVVKTGDLEPS